jgi:hypothetical protein
MSSGEKPKPPATIEERNPFDISRNSGPEVAAEIAKRMAAWKQARGRTTPASTTNRSSAIPSATISSGDAKPPPPIAAPVQPARMPKDGPGSQPAQTHTGSASKSAPRVPYFAVAATRRAMPPAPSPKQARLPTSGSDERAARTDEPAIVPSAPVREPVPQDQDQRQAADAAILATTPEPPVAESSPFVSDAIEEAPLETRAMGAPAQLDSSDTHPGESAPAAARSEPTPPDSSEPEPTESEPTETERRRAEARALKARWIAARDLDSLLERPAAGAAQPVEAAETASRDTGTGKDAGPLSREPQGVEEDLVRSSTEPDIAFEATAPVDEPVLPATPTAEPEATAVQTSPMAALDQAAGRKDPTFDVPKSPAPETASVANLDAGREAQALDIAALDEMAGRREPTFDAPIARAVPSMFDATFDAAPEAGVEAPDEEAPDEVVAPLRAEPVAAGAPDLTTRDATDDQRVLSIAALDAVAGRKEPTFDPPVQSSVEPAASDGVAAEARDEVSIAPADSAPTQYVSVEAANESPALGIDALDEAAGRKEPTFDEPVRPATVAPAAVAAQKPHIRLRPIETRIEARRVDTLRADPPLTARRPIFPHIEPEEWDVPPVVAARAGQERRGTGWAIGLGSLLLIAGITAPAAIWQQGRQGQDQVALVMPAPAPQQTQATPGSPAMGATTAQAPTQSTLPAAPQPEAPPSEATPPAVAAQQSSAQAPVEPKPEAPEAGPADASPAATLSAIENNDDVNEAPVVAPPSPTASLKTASTDAPMVARPFEPEQGDGPFLRAPTTGAATVPVAGAPLQSAAVGVKPNLMGQLKPKASAVASASKPVVSKPRTVQRQPKPFFQQSPDQMFETLIETLSDGKPVNPATKPASPSSRR